MPELVPTLGDKDIYDRRGRRVGTIRDREGGDDAVMARLFFFVIGLGVTGMGIAGIITGFSSDLSDVVMEDGGKMTGIEKLQARLAAISGGVIFAIFGPCIMYASTRE